MSMSKIPRLPEEIVRIILLHCPKKCLKLNKYYRNKIILPICDRVTTEYPEIKQDDIYKYLDEGVSSSMFNDFKCYFALDEQWKVMLEQDFFVEFLRGGGGIPGVIENMIYKAVTKYLTDFASSSKRDVYQIDTSFQHLFMKILSYLTDYCGFDMCDFFWYDIIECLPNRSDDIFGCSTLYNTIIQNTDKLDIFRLINTLRYMETEWKMQNDIQTVIRHYIGWISSDFISDEKRLKEELMKIQEIIKEELYCSDVYHGFNITTESNNILIKYHRGCKRVYFNNFPEYLLSSK